MPGIDPLTQVNLLEHLYAILDLSEEQSVLEPRSEVATMLRNLGHSRQLSMVACGQIQERQLVELLQLLVAHLDDLVVAMCQSFRAQSRPKLRPVELLCHLHCHFEIAALYCQLKSSGRVLDELQRYLGVAFLLQV